MKPEINIMNAEIKILTRPKFVKNLEKCLRNPVCLLG
jgi:hypothetical protein